jgi:peptidoglycan/LPS O-acetylase OafA/YrhL
VERLGYRPALDGIRGLAIVPVVLMHVFAWPREGSLGVDLFFVLSGFLITTLLLEERTLTGRISLANFYRRRVARLAPGLIALIAVYALATHGAHPWALLFALTYTTNIVSLFDANAIPWPLWHLWSLAQEEQFYLVWPPLFLLLVTRARGVLPKALGLLIVAVIVEKLALIAAGAGLHRIYFGPDTHAEPILIGCLFGTLSWWRPAFLRLTGLVALTAMVGTLFAAQWVNFLTPASPLRTLYFVACGFAVIAATMPGPLASLLAMRPLVFTGRISYSLYLWHVPVIAAVGMSAFDHGLGSWFAIAAATAVATLSFYLVEQPLRRRLRTSGSERTRGAAVPAVLSAEPS